MITQIPRQRLSPLFVTQELYGLIGRANAILDFPDLLDRFEPINLLQMDAVALQDRIDVKYVMTTHQLYAALDAISERYWVLAIDDTRLHPYETLYFDTSDFALYLHHHAGKRNRYKVRSRQYIETNQSFLEIKHKNKNRTHKNRITTHGLVTELTSETSHFIDTYLPIDTQALEPKLWNTFSRITLVSKRHQERLTLDLDVQFSNDSSSVTLPGIAIAEIKQNGINRDSDFIQQMRLMRVQEMSFSKYCIGVAMLYQNVKHNNFKPNLRLVHHLIGGMRNGY